jgi:hypothetical protein
MQAIALVGVLEAAEATFGAEGQRMVGDAIAAIVRGMIDAAREHTLGKGWQVRFDSTIPSGAPTCHFTMWDATEAETTQWNNYSRLLEAKALTRKKRE